MKQFWIIDKSLGDGKTLVENTYLGSSEKPNQKTLDQFGEITFVHVIEAKPTLEILNLAIETLDSLASQEDNPLFWEAEQRLELIKEFKRKNGLE